MKRTPLKQSKILPRKVPMARKSKPSTKERKAARGMPCLFNVAGVCNYDAATTVLAHFSWLGGGGMALKVGDHCAAHLCSACHDWCDGRTSAVLDGEAWKSERNFYAARALARMRLLDKQAA
jgi:hypothetical protein